MKLIRENIVILREFLNSYPNDMDLGKNIRNSFRNDVFVINLPNDMDLGKKIRKLLKNSSN